LAENTLAELIWPKKTLAELSHTQIFNIVLFEQKSCKCISCNKQLL